MNKYYNFNSNWYLIQDDQLVGPFAIKKIITMYYQGEIKGNELWQSQDGKFNKFTNAILFKIKNANSDV